MKKWIVVLFCAVLLATVAHAQKPDGDGAAHAPGSSVLADDGKKGSLGHENVPPVMTDAEKTEMLQAEKAALQISLQMAGLEKQYQELLARRNAAQQQLNDAHAAIQKRIGPEWIINDDTLAITAAPKPPAPAPSPAPAKESKK